MRIPIEITFRDMEPSPAVEAKIRAWVDRLETAFDGIVRCDVVVSAPHRRHRKGVQFSVRVMLTVPGEEIVVSHDPGVNEAHADVYVAVRDAFHAARRQLEDYVRRNLRGDVKTPNRPAHARVAFLDVEREWGYLEDASERRIYFHRNAVLGGIEQLQLGDEVRFDEEAGENGPQASTVAPIGQHGHHEALA
jgi:ribosome-associated translation inhibitor RaiA/cold shock CspA family protein